MQKVPTARALKKAKKGEELSRLPCSGELFLRQGRALLRDGSKSRREERLRLSCKRLKSATSFDPSCFEAWHLWGRALYLLGKRTKDRSYFSASLAKYEKALAHLEGQSPSLMAQLYWDLGEVWQEIAHLSGEIGDSCRAAQAYEKARAFNAELPYSFWKSCALLWMRMGEELGSASLLVEATSFCKNFIEHAPQGNEEGWLLLGRALSLLYKETHDSEHLQQADDAFKAAFQFARSDIQLYISWARLFLDAAILLQNRSHYLMAIQTCKMAPQWKQRPFSLVAILAEALCHLGVQMDRCSLIYEGMEQIKPFTHTQSIEWLYLQGVALHCLGLYYNDPDYHYQAVEIFQQGTSRDRTAHLLWDAMGVSNCAAALIDCQPESFERALHFFERALHLRRSSSYLGHYANCLLKYSEEIESQEHIKSAIDHFKEAMQRHSASPYPRPEWLFSCAVALERRAEASEDERDYIEALDALHTLLHFKPHYPHIHYQLAITCSHYGDFTGNPELFEKALHHFRAAYEEQDEQDEEGQLLLDWGYALLHLAELHSHTQSAQSFLNQAEYKMMQAVKQGHTPAYYALASLYSFKEDETRALNCLERARHFDVLPPLEELMEDEWLEGIREGKAFHEFIDKLDEGED